MKETLIREMDQPMYWAPASAIKISDSALAMVQGKSGERAAGQGSRGQQIQLLGAALITLAQDSKVAMPWAVKSLDISIALLEIGVVRMLKAVNAGNGPEPELDLKPPSRTP